VIEARFDDLTGHDPSFRLVGPAGVLEARRLDEVTGVLAAAEQAAARGLWVAGYVAYEAAPGLDPALRVRSPGRDDPFAAAPLAWFAMFEGREETVLPDPPPDQPVVPTATWAASMTRPSYDAAIGRIHQHIAAGETYQVNFTLRLRARVDGDARGLYRDLCFAQRGAYAGYLDTGRFRVLSASPELFFQIDGWHIATKPMKGTAPRGRWRAEDEEIKRRLEGSVKDRAENAMIVDLLRNDLGIVCEVGSVAVPELMIVEDYATVHQLISTIEGTLAADRSAAECARACFPGGSMTGAPKQRTMEIIDDIEAEARGVYSGAIGYFGLDGVMDLSIVIRTIVLREGRTTIGAGGAIVMQSDPEDEFDEILLKARAPMAAIARTVTGSDSLDAWSVELEPAGAPAGAA
jgi:para-aminobenzoate synthetase/4-amino-4-deoxychorismate lyase